ncbi:MAG: EAL domain-containing protein [Colwellia sp.]|nr:EAL domain-containing protein [Colwellia sp.]
MKFSRIRTLQSKILILFVFLLLVVQLVSFFTTYRANKQLVSTQLDNKLLTAKEVFKAQFSSRRSYLSAITATVAKDHGLKSILEESTASILSALDNHRNRVDADIALIIDIDGVIKAQLVTYQDSNGRKRSKKGSGQDTSFPGNNEFFQEKTTQLIRLDQALYQLSLAPIKSGARIISWVGFGRVIDSNFADEFAKLIDVNIGFLLKGDNLSQVVTYSTLDGSFDFNEAFATQILNDKNEDYISENIHLGDIENSALVAVLFKSKADLLKNIKVDWQYFALLIALTLALSLLGALFIAKGITKPIKNLIKQVKSITHGNYEGDIKVEGSIEMRQLSDEFNHMTQAVISREKTISYQAFHDPLTNLSNRNSLLNSLVQRSEKASDFILLQLNLRRIEEINDTLGHKVGDQVIIEVAKRLQRCQLENEHFHLGGHSFVMIVDNQDIEHIIATVLPELEKSYQYENISLHFQYVVGIAYSSQQNRKDIAEILQKSNVALQYAKKQKKLYQVYDPQFDTNTVERLHLTNSLKTAIEENQLVLFYQPKLSLSTMKLSHVEALVRWQHPEKGLIPPDSFISIAEKTGQMDALTRWVTQEAIAQYLRWQQAGLHIKIAINISAENLADKSYSDFVIALKQQHDLPDDDITLEVTEDAVVADPEQATQILSYLREHGFKLSIDDYGTGYSSLAQLKQLPVQELKIDRSFVQHLMSNENDKIIVRSTIELAHNMGLSVVAEGIEDEAALLWLKEHGCELAQGYFISRPIPEESFNTWLVESNYSVEKLKMSC